jgi:hypothetical protein
MSDRIRLEGKRELHTNTLIGDCNVGMSRYKVLMRDESGEESVITELAVSPDAAIRQAESSHRGKTGMQAKPDSHFTLAANAVNVAIRLASRNRVRVPWGQSVWAFHMLEEVADRAHETAEDIGQWLYDRL